jgi:CubicO group peptidase (beta-lactamase class C family)
MNTTSDIDRPASYGFVAPGFEAVRNKLDSFLLDDQRYSVQLAAICKGEVVVDLVGGPDLTADSITGVFSVSKGVATVTLATLIADGRLDLDAPVTTYWPEFGAAGKQSVLVRELLSHQVGLVNVDGLLEPEDLFNSSRGASKLAASLPAWRPGSTFGYHAWTFGVLIEELHRRIAGESLQATYERDIRAPRDIDFYLGLPESQESRYRPTLPMEPTLEQQLEMETTAIRAPACRPSPSTTWTMTPASRWSCPTPEPDGSPAMQRRPGSAQHEGSHRCTPRRSVNWAIPCSTRRRSQRSGKSRCRASTASSTSRWPSRSGSSSPPSASRTAATEHSDTTAQAGRWVSQIPSTTSPSDTRRRRCSTPVAPMRAVSSSRPSFGYASSRTREGSGAAQRRPNGMVNFGDAT